MVTSEYTILNKENGFYAYVTYNYGGGKLYFNVYRDNIIDLNITHQAVVKQGELLENPEEDNQQPSIYRNIIEGSTTIETASQDVTK